MASVKNIESINTKWKSKFETMGISTDQFTVVLEYLREVGAVQFCGTSTGCDGACDDGYTCTQLNNGNCICVRDTAL